MGKIRQWEHKVTPEESGKTLERILQLHGFSKKEISRLKFRPSGMMVNGTQRRSTDILKDQEWMILRLEDREKEVPEKEVPKKEVPEKEGSEKEVSEKKGSEKKISEKEVSEKEVPEKESRLRISAEYDCPVIYEDSDLLIADKPSGLSCHPGKGHYEENLGSILSARCEEYGEYCAIRLIGRLDRDTSGAVVFAKNQAAAARLWAQREKGEFRKDYLAVLHGVLEQREGTVRFPTGPRKGEKNRMEIQENGRRTVTHYRVLGYYQYGEARVTLVECSLETGRTHQIRVHMAALGHPVLGDPFYGDPVSDARVHSAPGTTDSLCFPSQTFPGKAVPMRLALHAYRVSLLQPFSHTPINLTTFHNFPWKDLFLHASQQSSCPLHR